MNEPNQNQPIALNNPETAAQFDCTYTRDMIIHVPGHWKGLTSNVPPAIADILISQGHKAFKRKVATVLEAKAVTE